jgi:hypothetical protein
LVSTHRIPRALPEALIELRRWRNISSSLAEDFKLRAFATAPGAVVAFLFSARMRQAEQDCGRRKALRVQYYCHYSDSFRQHDIKNMQKRKVAPPVGVGWEKSNERNERRQN